MRVKSKKKLKKKLSGYVNTYQLQTVFVISFFLIISAYVAMIFLIHYAADVTGVFDRHTEAGAGAVSTVYFVSILCVILALFTYNIILNKIFRPLISLSNALKEIAEGNYHVSLDYRGHISELEVAIRNFNRMAKELNSVEMIRNDFIANVSHEFKTPLSSIMGYVTLLQDRELTDEERAEYIKKTFFNIDKLNNLTENILAISRLENQNYSAESTTYRLDEQIREAIVLLEPKWDSKKIDFELDLLEIMYTGQKPLLFQVWVNLISNAIKFSGEKGLITISIQERKKSVCVIISDEGIGMSDETKSHIFDKFYQGDTSRRSQGNGLGLALVWQIVQIAKGHVTVESEEGKGTSFCVYLPNEKEASL